MALTARDHPAVIRLLPYVPTPLALLIFWYLNREGLITPRPYWELFVLLLGAGVANVVALVVTTSARVDVRIQVAPASPRSPRR